MPAIQYFKFGFMVQMLFRAIFMLTTGIVNPLLASG